ncbi:Sec-independent protein translocase protein TatAy [compost metagenome]
MYSGTLIEFLNMGGGEIMLILGVVLLLFGGKKLPELARGLGKGLRDFKDASEGVKREIHRNINSVGITDEINDFKSTFNDADNSRHHPYEYKPEDNAHNDDTHKPAIDFHKDEPAEDKENTTTETDKTKI